MNKNILKLMDRKFPPTSEGVATLIIYGDGSGMIIRLGANNIRIPVYDIPRCLEFSNLEDLKEKLSNA